MATNNERLEVLFDELAELVGQRNAIDARIVDIVAAIDHGNLWGVTGARSVAALVAWRTESSLRNAKAVAAVAHRVAELPRCAEQMREGRLSLDQVGVIAQKAAPGSDEHYAKLASVATVSQLNKALGLEPRPKPEPKPAPERSVTKSSDEHGTYWRIRLGAEDSAIVDAALNAHRDALIADWKRAHSNGSADDATGDVDLQVKPPLPNAGDAFMSLVEAGWDVEVARRPHGQHTTVVVHVDVEKRIAALHVGPVLSDADRQYLTCDATCEVWFERNGEPIGVGRSTRAVSRRLRRVLEYRHPTCAVPGCGATRGLHAHIVHWEDGGVTELDNLVLVCPYHHRLHHRGAITIRGPADSLVVTDSDGRPLPAGSLARPPNRPPPAVASYPGPTGERADWWWYQPFEPQTPSNSN
ncbi:HNH endonuclease [Mycobacterium sp. CPCC 205710]|uniref:HNH endonuclease n=1 Tax=Mycobacterium deserti TaxID=2978347 RepID=A0ABT2MHR3_9MYCO|nr:HNH endonuclease signature motif containing protein [Mycobacterium deserti]MCT7661819.1 HNH endonuclease [Mycobacterium deserti]